MSFLNPWLLLGVLGISLPILAHLLNRYQVKTTDWAAMQFMNRNVRIRSRQLRLRDIVLLILRCLALLFLILAVAKPVVEKAGAFTGRFGSPQAGVILALDASFSMQHSDAGRTRFEQALDKAGMIAAKIRPGDPVSLVLLGDEHKVVLHNMAFDPERFSEELSLQQASPGALDMNSVPRRLKEMADDMDAAHKEVYIVSDMQEQDWKGRSSFSRDSFAELSQSASVFLVPVRGGGGNLAVTGLDLASGVLRKGTVARYRATVRNLGPGTAQHVKVTGMVDDISVDTKVIPSIAAGASETVSLFVPFRNAGPARITAKLEPDALPVDDVRRAVAVIRERVAVLCVEATSGGSGDFIASALRARGTDAGEEDFTVRSVPWVSLPGEDLNAFDVVVLADVPEITPDQARRLDRYVRSGNGLIWFAGDAIKAASWNKHSAGEATPLLPAVIGQADHTSDAMGVGRSLNPLLPDHAVCRPLLSLPEDLLSETRFLKVLQVEPAPTSFTVLSLAGSASPILLEHALGRGHVFMFTTSAEPAWNNMALTPVFPMLLQQMVTYLTGRAFEKTRLVGDTLALTYDKQPDASDAVFETPSGKSLVVPVGEHRNQYVAMLESADETGFYLARASVQAPGMPVAVNVDTRESNVASMPAAELVNSLDEAESMTVLEADDDLPAAIGKVRTARTYWHTFMVLCLVLLIVESLLADRMYGKKASA